MRAENIPEPTGEQRLKRLTDAGIVLPAKRKKLHVAPHHRTDGYGTVKASADDIGQMMGKWKRGAA